MMKKMVSVAVMAACVAFSGCATPGNDEVDGVEETAAILEGVAEIGTVAVLRNNPGHAIIFRETVFQLRELAGADSLTYADVVAVLNRLPIDALARGIGTGLEIHTRSNR